MPARGCDPFIYLFAPHKLIQLLRQSRTARAGSEVRFLWPTKLFCAYPTLPAAVPQQRLIQAQKCHEGTQFFMLQVRKQEPRRKRGSSKATAGDGHEATAGFQTGPPRAGTNTPPRVRMVCVRVPSRFGPEPEQEPSGHLPAGKVGSQHLKLFGNLICRGCWLCHFPANAILQAGREP